MSFIEKKFSKLFFTQIWTGFLLVAALLFWIYSVTIDRSLIFETSHISTVQYQSFKFANITKPPKNFLVWSKQCRMPNVDPFTEDVKKIFHRKKYSICSNDLPLTEKIYDQNFHRYLLRINMNATKKFPLFNCCYQEIQRETDDSTIKLLPSIEINQEVIIPRHIDGVIVTCKSGNSTHKGKIIQRDAHFFIQDRNISKKISQLNNQKQLSVMVIGIDSLSRFNLRRNMPKTVEFLKRTNWFEMAGYNKIGDNTYPNLMALLTGYNTTAAYEKCQHQKFDGLDKCPFIWKEFKKYGYRTAYAEDVTWMSTFNYLKKGFKNPPVDYYFRPFMLAIEKYLSKSKSFESCIGFKYPSEYIFDYGLEFAIRNFNEPFFGLFWANSFSHNTFDLNSAFDLRMEMYLQQLLSNEISQNTILIFLSDHGMRFGPLRELSQGFLEERLPMFFIHLPKWFSDNHPDFVYSLKVNENRLTNTFDAYNTLQHILKLSSSNINESKLMNYSNGCPKNCQTLFQPVLSNRSCNDIGINDHWCSCIPMKSIKITKNDVKLKFILNFVINEMNIFLKNHSLNVKCEKLKLKSIIAANHMNISHFRNDLAHYEIQFLASPSQPEFEVMATYSAQNKSVNIENIFAISRLNLYASDSKCITNEIAKKFCICKKNKKI